MADKTEETKPERFAEGASKIGATRGELFVWLSDHYVGSQQQWNSWMNRTKAVSEKWLFRYMLARGDKDGIVRFFEHKYGGADARRSQSRADGPLPTKRTGPRSATAGRKLRRMDSQSSPS